MQVRIVEEASSNELYKHIYEPSVTAQLELIRRDPYNIKYFEYPPEVVQIEAAKNNGIALQFIKHPCKRALGIYNKRTRKLISKSIISDFNFLPSHNFQNIGLNAWSSLAIIHVC